MKFKQNISFFIALSISFGTHFSHAEDVLRGIDKKNVEREKKWAEVTVRRYDLVRKAFIAGAIASCGWIAYKLFFQATDSDAKITENKVKGLEAKVGEIEKRLKMSEIPELPKPSAAESIAWYRNVFDWGKDTIGGVPKATADAIKNIPSFLVSSACGAFVAPTIQKLVFEDAHLSYQGYLTQYVDLEAHMRMLAACFICPVEDPEELHRIVSFEVVELIKDLEKALGYALYLADVVRSRSATFAIIITDRVDLIERLADKVVEQARVRDYGKMLESTSQLCETTRGVIPGTKKR